MEINFNGFQAMTERLLRKDPIPSKAFVLDRNQFWRRVTTGKKEPSIVVLQKPKSAKEKKENMINVQVIRIRYGFMIFQRFRFINCLLFYRLVTFLQSNGVAVFRLQNNERFHIIRQISKQTSTMINCWSKSFKQKLIKDKCELSTNRIIHKLSSKRWTESKSNAFLHLLFNLFLSPEIVEDSKQGFSFLFLRLGAII